MQYLPLDVFKARCQAFKMVCSFCSSCHNNAIAPFTTVSAKLLLTTFNGFKFTRAMFMQRGPSGPSIFKEFCVINQLFVHKL